VDAWNGKFEDIPFYIHAMKEPGYVMSVMSTYGTIKRTGKEMERSVNINGQQQNIILRFLKTIFDTNIQWMIITTDESWETKSWENRFFAFLVAVTEVNIMLATKYFYSNDISSQVAI
jgi:hypothetical protein